MTSTSPLTAPTLTAPRPPRLETAALAEIVGGLARAEDLWRPHVHHDAHERARVRLLATPVYEVWLLGWTPGQSVGLHDHGGSNGAFVVVDGVLTESHVDVETGAVGERVVRVGTGGEVPAGRVHDVANRSAGLATSIHAYSKPLRSMGFFETVAASGPGGQPVLRGHRIRTFWVDPEPPVLATG